MRFLRNFRLFYLILIFAICSSCKPAIHSFRVTPLVITGDQKIHIALDVKGTASLEYNEHFSPDSIQLLDFTLIVNKGGKEERKNVQVQKLKSLAPLNITFATSKLDGDFVEASGENNNNQWSNFQIVSVSSVMSRDIMVSHSGRMAELKSDGSSSQNLSGTTAGGNWSLKTRLTTSEKADSSKIPQELKIRAVIKPSNP